VNFTKIIRTSSLVVQWNAVGDISDTLYIVTWSGGGFTTTRMTSYTITGLTVDTNYTITVSAANLCGGPEFTTNILFSPDNTSAIANCIINPTITIVRICTISNSAIPTTTVTSTNTVAIINSPIATTTNNTVSPTSITKVSNSVDSASKFQAY